MTEDPHESLYEQLKNFLFETAKIVAAISVISVPIAYFTAPIIDNYVDRKIAVFVEAIELERRPDILEFNGNGVVLTQGPVRPGDNVTILYLLKSNTNCQRNVEIRWVGPAGNILTHLTSVRPTTQAQITKDFYPFPVTLTIPDNAPNGPLVYAALIRAAGECKGFNRQVVVPLSSVIRVER